MIAARWRGHRVFVYRTPVDMRKAYDALSTLVSLPTLVDGRPRASRAGCVMALVEGVGVALDDGHPAMALAARGSMP